MSGKYMVVTQRHFDSAYDTFAEADTQAKRELAYRDSYDTNRKIFVVQQIANYDRPAVDNAIVTTL